MKMQPDENKFMPAEINMPPEELVKRVATLLAVALYRARLPYIPGDKIKAGDLEGVAAFVLGGLVATERGLEKAN
jgi:hypothetical protein